MSVDLPPRYVLHPTNPVLGEGGMGKVYRARDVVLDVPVALKVVRQELTADPRFARMFAMEVRIAARFAHEHIVPLHDLGALADGTPFLGLALADAGSFAKIRKTADWPEILRLTGELLEALGHLHARGVLHRDIKPENVLLNREADGLPHVWLADLGLAKAATDLARKKGRMEGTPGYMAPEQKLGLVREYGPWTDLYSIGVLLWDLVTGKLPFGQELSPLECPLPPLVPRKNLTVPAGLEKVLANLLAGEPLSRYDLAADLATELAALGPATFGFEDATKGATIEPRGGTVAPSAPRPTPPSTSLSETPSSGGGLVEVATSTWFGEDASDHAPATAPAWNRPLPPPLPPTPPPEPGRGGTARASLPLLALRDVPLVARDAFRRLLWEEARRVATQHRPRVVLIVGEAGSGKTHLVHSVVQALARGGWAESATLGWETPPGADDGYPGATRALLRPWNESRKGLQARLVRWLSRERGALDDATRVEASLLARWCGLLDPGEEPVPAGLGLRGLLRWLEGRAWRGLSVLVLDDVGRAVEDGDGLSIAEGVLATADDGEPRPLLVVATLRSEDLLDASLAEQVRVLEAAGARRVDLPRLDRAGTEALLAETLTLTPDLARQVVDRCEGNPLFARQLLLEWTHRGWLVDAGGLRYALAPGVDADAAMPADAEALFGERIDALVAQSGQPEALRDVLQQAALVGQTLPRGLLDALAGPDLAPAVHATNLFVEKGDLATFDHRLLHQTLRAKAQARPDAAALHGRIVVVWARWEQEAGGDHDLGIGRHAHAAGQWVLATDRLLKAAQTAWQRGLTKDLGEAARLASDACNRAPKVRWRAGEARLWLARTSQAEGDGQVAAERFFEAHQIFVDLDDPDGVGQSLVGMGWAALRMGKIDRAERRYKEALELAHAQADVGAEIRALRGLAWLEQQKRNFEGSEILFTRAAARSEEMNDPRGVTEALLGQAFLARRTGRLDEALEIYGEAEEVARGTNDLLAVARARHGKGVTLWQKRDNTAAEALLRDARGIAEDLGSAELLGQCGVALADVLRSRGDVDRARGIYGQFLRQAQRRKAFEEVVLARLGLAHLALLGKDLSGMQAQVKATQRVLEAAPGHWLWATWKLFAAVLFAMQGDAEKTRDWVWAAQDLGLGDTADQDAAFLLTVVCNRAKQERWDTVLRVAGPLAAGQWGRLGREKERARIDQMSKDLLGTATPAPLRR